MAQLLCIAQQPMIDEATLLIMQQQIAQQAAFAQIPDAVKRVSCPSQLTTTATVLLQCW